MKKFIRRIIYLWAPLLLVMAIGLFLPSTPRASRSLLFANIIKDSLLQYADSPRIIFVGGSNLSFGLNSEMIKYSLKLNPINTGINASIGLRYMLENTIQYVRKGDVVVLIPEYTLLKEDYNSGSEVLLRSVVEVNPSKLKLLSMEQVLKLIPFIPKYAFSKFMITEYIRIKEDDVYSVHSFNQYGDTYTHWNLKRRLVRPERKTDGYVNQDAIEGMRKFRAAVEKRHAVLLLSYPCLQDISYFNILELIKNVEKEYVKNKFELLGSPERYRMPDSLLFNTAYHLNKEGVDLRTRLLIEDLTNFQSKIF